jgi:DNA repair protein RecO (recombination protein O)
MSWESRQLAAEMFRAPIEQFVRECWPRQCGADLRKFLMQRVERQLEKKVTSRIMLDKLD